MRVFRFHNPTGPSPGPRLGLEIEGARFNLSAAGKDFADLSSWLSLPDPLAAVRSALATARRSPITQEVALLPPIDTQEVWASGVTYLRSKVARMEESREGQSSDFYDRVYEAERPEIFFKATPARVVGHDQPIRIRRDSKWDVPEPELALVLSASGALAGVTIGNDVSSRSIEGENPLYLPQAKVFDGCCALGPSIELIEGKLEPRRIQMTIERDGAEVFSGETSTSSMRRTPEELAGWLFRELSFRGGVILLTGAGIVPPDAFTLHAADVVRISIEGIGTLSNTVAGVS